MADPPFQPAVFQFIQDHLNDEPAALMLQRDKFPDLPIKEIAEQIKARKKAQSKLPEWSSNPEIIFPPAVSLEQCSSELTAKYKAKLVKGKEITDLTGGFGIDLYYLAKGFKAANYVEQSEKLVELANYNFTLLKVAISCSNTAAEQYLADEGSAADVYFIDPARRTESNEKVFRIEDCTPDMNLILPMLLKRNAEVLIKMSPLLDIHQALNSLTHVEEIHVVSVKNECKEVLFKVVPGFDQIPRKIAINLEADQTESFEFTDKQEGKIAEFSQPLNYLYEPNASILKAGGFNAIANAFGVKKIGRNSHLYTSDKPVTGFPGRSFHIDCISTLNKKKLKTLLEANKANITVRNYPMSVAQIRKKTRIKEGGDVYLFATTLMDQSHKVIVCKKLDQLH